MVAAPISVALDVTACLGNTTGVGTFTGEILAGLAAADDIDLAVYALTWRGRDRVGTVAPPGTRIASRPAAARPLREVWMRTDHPTIEWWTGRVDVVHGPNYVVPPTRHAAAVVSVFDLTPVRFPELCTPDTLQYPRLIERAISRGAWIHTCSTFVAEEIRAHFAVDPTRVVVVPAGVRLDPTDDRPEPVGDVVARLVNGSDPFLVALGTIEPRKDLPALVEAFDDLASKRRRLRLVIAGPDGWGTDEFAQAVGRAAHRDRIDRVGWVGNAERTALLGAARALVYPSRYEGFGLPPLEAMARSTPVVTTDAGSLPEVVGDAAEVVSARLLAEDRPAGVRALADAIAVVLDEHDTDRQARIRRGLDRVATLPWERSIAGLVELYRHAADAHHR
ncbi:MAG: glycosyltransferase family 4 protein [Actinobacteria bacterium]|nr:glycosyltransferase family 4 protein [Actinomycetota bacterium]